MSRTDVFAIDWDEDGLHVSFNMDDVSSRRSHTIELDGQVHLVLDGMTAIELHNAIVAKVGDYVAEFEEHRASYERASPAERAAVLGHDASVDDGYAPDDPKSTGYHDRMVGDA